jgi:hypothetical protein
VAYKAYGSHWPVALVSQSQSRRSQFGRSLCDSATLVLLYILCRYFQRRAQLWSSSQKKPMKCVLRVRAIHRIFTRFIYNGFQTIFIWVSAIKTRSYFGLLIPSLFYTVDFHLFELSRRHSPQNNDDLGRHYSQVSRHNRQHDHHNDLWYPYHSCSSYQHCHCCSSTSTHGPTEEERRYI